MVDDLGVSIVADREIEKVEFEVEVDVDVDGWRYGARVIWGSLGGDGQRNGSRASRVIIHGESVVPKDFPRKGPRGGISRPWMSRAVNLLVNINSRADRS